MIREEVIEVIKAYKDKLNNSASNQLDGDIEAFDMAIKALEQKPKTGHWIEKDDNLYECSECGQYIYSETEHDLLEFHAFCGRCGAKMESEE